MEHLLFAAYLIFFSWLLTRVRFFTQSGLTNAQLVIVYLLKVMAGIIYGWIGVYYGELAQMLDTWSYHYESLKEYKILLSDPGAFVTSLFHNPYQDGYTRFLSEESWWNDLKGNLFIKILAVFNVFSFGNYYINVIFYSFITLFGPVAVYRVMKHVFPKMRIPVLLGTFLIPSFLYWTSGLHKDGLIFIGFGLIIYHFYYGLSENRFGFKRILIILLSLLIILGLRNFYFLPLIPALLCWYLSAKMKFHPVKVFSAVYLLFAILFFTAKYIHPKLDFVSAVIDKQQAFLKLAGSSSVQVNELKPTVGSFLFNLPQALSMSILRPFPADVHHLLSLAAAVEVGFFVLMFLLFILWRKNGLAPSAYVLFLFFFSITLLMMIGYSVNNLGAIVRYRSVILPFLMVPLIAKIDWPRISKLILGDINKNNNF